MFLGIFEASAATARELTSRELILIVGTEASQKQKWGHT
jgi:hypothetical protein